jgi:hypothetical protein
LSGAESQSGRAGGGIGADFEGPRNQHNDPNLRHERRALLIGTTWCLATNARAPSGLHQPVDRLRPAKPFCATRNPDRSVGGATGSARSAARWPSHHAPADRAFGCNPACKLLFRQRLWRTAVEPDRSNSHGAAEPGSRRSWALYRSRDDGTLQVICPTSQNLVAGSRHASDRPATLHGVVFEFFGAGAASALRPLAAAEHLSAGNGASRCGA